MTLVQDRHILLDDRGEAWVGSTNVKVIEIVLDKLAHGSTVEDMHLQLPHLSIAELYSALAYYHDHKNAFDERIAREREEIAAVRASTPPGPGREKHRAMGLRP